ncbi:hypothetical protein CSH63_21595 [Micromonospora tulbaghiae]|uniref:MFS transporter n=1 Tax=Micromonospora tulbaghiae TaxID=479978 RepID=A0A386WRJ1_9ACTN|nr:MFS transporter [Micromonospora tulbaghiae]AYF30010.1 hypothetical protein CSH63_21595 [Micromonospora tulbaghiae]
MAQVMPVMVPAFVARVPVGMYSIALLLMLSASSGSYAIAGAATAGYSAATGVGAPIAGRLADRRGPVVVLVGLAVMHAVALVALVTLVYRSPGRPGRGTVAALVGLAALAGLLQPPVAAVVRAHWSRRFGAEDTALRTALAVESTVGETVFIAGPLLVAGFGVFGGPPVAVLAGAVMTAAGTCWLAATTAVRQAPAITTPAGGRWSALAVPGLRILVVVQALLFAGFACVEVGVLATAEEHGAAWAGGILLAVWAGASVAGAIGWAARDWPGPPRRQLAVLLGAGAVGTAMVSLPASWPGIAAALVLSGLCIAPAGIVAQTVLSRVADPARRTESFAWMTAAAVLGSSAATLCSGWLVEQHGAVAVLRAAALCAALATVVVVLGRRALLPPEG